MTTEINSSFDLYRANLGLALRMWTAHYRKPSEVGAAVTPMHEWVQRFEQALAGAMDGAAIWGGETGGTTPGASGDGRLPIKGEQHVG